MFAARLLLLFLAPMLVADEDKIPLDKDSAHRMEVLVLKQQLAQTQLQLLREQLYKEYLKAEGARDLEKELRQLQSKTSELMQKVYKEAGLSITEYSLDLENMVFERIEPEEEP
jgi:uncharacterized protein YlxW (UPF0749 family)